jgi:hypothetical protein
MPCQTFRLLAAGALLPALLAGVSLAQNDSPPQPRSPILALGQRKAALEMELGLVRGAPDLYYLVVDLPAGEVYLKCHAQLLKTCRIVDFSLPSGSHRVSSLLRLADRIDPFTPEPGNAGVRLRGRTMPLDFLGRLVEGPREASRLYFRPSLLIQPGHLPVPSSIGCVVLNGSDVKALGSALEPGSLAVWIPPSDGQSGSPP